jgi:uncharacterized protein (DUF3820 family)
MSDTDPSAVVIPFGKHKGRTVAELLATDPAYVEWLTAQGWLAQRFAELHTALLTRGAGSDDTPQHNALQARFLDPTYRCAFLLAALGREALSAEREDTRKDHEYWGKEIKRLRLTEQPPWRGTLRTEARFEQRGLDIELFWGFDAISIDKYSTTSRLAIELKPSLGDDYPSVMRQMGRLAAGHLLVEQYTGAGVPLDQVRAMFAANRISLTLAREVDAELANARALIVEWA